MTLAVLLPADPDADPYADLARRLAASDAGALAALFDAAHDALVDYAAGILGDDAAARDVAQETFVRLWRHRAAIDPARSLRALLYRTARNLAYNAVRDARTRARLLADGDALPDAARPWHPPTPDAWLDARELGARLRAAIDALPARQREALVLSRFDGLSHDEIADVMGCAPRTVNNHLVRALSALRARLHPAYDAPRDAAPEPAADATPRAPTRGGRASAPVPLPP